MPFVGIGVGIGRQRFRGGGGAPFVGLLDEYSGAAAAYSLRQLSSTYTGDAIRVRRASDNTELNIGFVNNELDTASLTTFCSGTDGFVTTWYDQSGNARDVTQSTASNQPQIVSSGSVILQNSNPCLQFDGTNDGLRNITQIVGLDYVNGPLTSFSVSETINPNISGISQSIWAIGGSGRVVGSSYITGHALSARFNGSAYDFRDAIVATSDKQYLHSLVFDTTTFDFYQNNTAATLAVNPFYDTTSNILSIGIGLGGVNHRLSGKIQEIVIYNSNKSANRSDIQNNINTYYAIY